MKTVSPSLDGIIPCNPIEAVMRLTQFVDVQMPYRLGSGGYVKGPVDAPWTADKFGIVGSDCLGAITHAYALSRHRPGFNRNAYGAWDILDVEDDINSNSLIGDARHKADLFVELAIGELLQVGDVLAYPTIKLVVEHSPSPTMVPGFKDWMRHADGSIMEWIGHGELVKNPNNVRVGGPYTNAQVIQCYGGNNRRPAIRMTDASAMDHHDNTWPKLEHRTTVLRLNPAHPTR